MSERIRFVDLADWKSAARTVGAVVGGLRKQFVFDEVKQVDGEDQTLQFVISTGVVDRDRDTVNPNGWKLDSFQRNPVVLWAHDYSSPPIARAPAVWVEDNKLKSRAQFTPREVNPFGHMIYRMLAADFLRATSVGFNPIKWQFNEERKFGVDFLEQELLEYSIVPVPANPEALIEARSAGIDVTPLKDWAERVLDTWHAERGVWLPRSKIERAFEIIDGKRSFPAPAPPAPQPESKGAISYAGAHPNGTPKAPEDAEWDGPAEVAAASVDDLKVMCAWVDSENPDVKSAYKLPHHKAAGQHAVVWRAVSAAGNATMGARGGVDIPEDDIPAVRAHLARHYREFEKTPPWETEEGRAFDALRKLSFPRHVVTAAMEAELKEALGRILLPGVFGEKHGRVLSAANEDRIRRAKALLEEVLAQLDDEPETGDDEAQEEDSATAVELADADDGQEVSAGDVRELIAEVLRQELASLTGRIT